MAAEATSWSCESRTGAEIHCDLSRLCGQCQKHILALVCRHTFPSFPNTLLLGSDLFSELVRDGRGSRVDTTPIEEGTSSSNYVEVAANALTDTAGKTTCIGGI